MGGSNCPDWQEPPGGRFSILETIDWDLLTRVLERDLLWFTGEQSLPPLSVSGSPPALARRDLDGDLRLVGGEVSRLCKLSNTVRLLRGSSSLGGLDLALFAFIFALDFLLETGDVGGLGGG